MHRADREASQGARVRWRWLTVASLVALPILIWFTRDALLGSALECRRKPTAHCVFRVGASDAVIPLEGVSDARIRRRKIVSTYMVDLAFTDGSTRRQLPDGRVQEYHLGPFVAALRAAEIARRLQIFLRDPKLQTLTIRQRASARRVAVLFVGLFFVLCLGIWAALRGWCRPRAPNPPTDASGNRT